MPLRAIAVLLVLVASPDISFGHAEPDGNTGIEGTIMLSPAHGGPLRMGEADSKPLGGFTFNVEKDSVIVASFTTDGEGKFRLSLPPGHYTVSEKGPHRAIGHFGPFAADVVAGKMTVVEWKCDSGMR